MKKEDKYPLFYLIAFILIFIIGAIKPLSFGGWAIESFFSIIIIPFLIITYKKFRFSNTSYTLILVFLILQIIGSHYTYSQVPIGFWLQDLLDLSRNHYDRIVHFAFGLFLYLPTLELYRKLSNNYSKIFFNYLIVFFIIMAAGAIFEVAEYLVILTISPDLGSNYLGTQGDHLDPYQDLALKLISSFILMIYFYYKRR